MPTSSSLPTYGFVIDNRKCIGCHACSVACKSENEVPLGVNRTWVKYVETGQYPHTRRHFQVTRCNHCANPPCVRICPTAAMYQRPDGIVEFDGDVCIGCKACMQACPYDAIYIDPETNTAAKCHYCAHRTDRGLEPACVVVCPEQAIIAGDMADPDSQISQLLARHQVSVRKPEQGTAPKLFYIDGHDVTLHPTATERTPESFMWADVIPLPENGAGRTAVSSPHNKQSHQGHPQPGPIQLGGKMAEHMVQVAYNAQHKLPWHWPVPAYLVTKGLAAGLYMLLALGWLRDWFPFDGLTAVAAGFLCLLFMGLTTGLLVYDLDRPERFLYILLRPQWRSWLARGAVLLIGFTLLLGGWWLWETAVFMGWLGEGGIVTVRPWLLAAGLPLAGGVAIYTAFLFAQAEGRDLWQSPLLPAHLVVQALLLGSGLVLLLGLLLPLAPDLTATAQTWFVLLLLVDLFMLLVGEFAIPHASEVAVRAADEIRNGRYRYLFWGGAVGLGHILPLLFTRMFPAEPAMWGLCALFVLIGIYLYEYLYVMAPQEIPNS